MKNTILFFAFAAFLLHAGEGERALFAPTTVSPLRDRKDVAKVTEITVVRRDRQGEPLEINERTYLQCCKCKSPYKQGGCSCSYDALPAINEVAPAREPLMPNRCMQALIACISFPQALCFACEVSEDDIFRPNTLHERYVGPFELPLEYDANECCSNGLLFCPCCVPQVEAEQ
jgi:hypothetical protein